MKKYLNIIGMAWLTALLFTACSPEKYESPNAAALPVAANYADNISISIDSENRYAYLHFDAAAGITPVWLIDGTTYSSDFTVKKFYEHAGKHTVEFRVKNANGISRDALVRDFDMVIAEPQWVAIDGTDNLWNAANEKWSWVYKNDDMSSDRPAPTVTAGERSYMFTLPLATVNRQQAMLTFQTDLTIEDIEQEYDFIAVMESSASFTAKAKVYDRRDANNFLFEEDITLEAGKTTRFFVRQVSLVSKNSSAVPISGGSGRNARRVTLRFDFGTNPANTTITIKDIIFQKHINKK